MYHLAKPMIAICGLDCAECPAYLAHIRNDDRLRKETARRWTKEHQYAVPLLSQEIDCTGCQSEQKHFKHCATCAVRACGQEKKIDNCGFCPKYSTCDKIQSLHEKIPLARKNCEVYYLERLFDA